MIVVRLMGGLGNQMFQWAAGRALALERSTELKLDLGFLEGTGRGLGRPFALGCFELRWQRATEGELRWSREREGSHTLRELVKTAVHPRRLTIVRDEAVGQMSVLDVADRRSLLVGYWQGERHFKPRADAIRNDFRFEAAPPGAAAMSEEIDAGTASVAVHVRRGDYAADAKTREFHGLLPVDYYERATRAIRERIDSPHFFVFSDEPDWARTNLSFDGPTTYVAGNEGDAAWVDLGLMSRCRHHVIANSSFSWWGAWLGTAADKLVVAPARWFRSTGDSGIVPDSWLRI